MNKPHDLEARETAARLFEEWWAADVEYYNADETVSDEDYARLKIRAERAERAYRDQPLRVRSDDDKALRCAFSHAPLLTTDVTLPVLASVIGAESYDPDEPLLPMFSEMEPA